MGSKKKYLSAYQSAFADISKELRNEYDQFYTMVNNHESEVWVVSPQHMNNKETRRLNRELGISNVNKNWNKK